MASRIAALQAKLGGGAMIMGGMRPGGGPPMRKKKARQRRASLDNSALLSRPTVDDKGGNRKKKRKTAVNFDTLVDEKTDDAFQESLASDINMDQTKPVDDNKTTNQTNNNNTKPFKMPPVRARGGGMGGLLAQAGAGGFRKKKQNTNKKDDDIEDNLLGKPRDRSSSHSFSKGVTTSPIIDLGPGPKGAYAMTQKKTEAVEKKEAPSGLKCMAVKEDMGLKTVRLFAAYDKYFEAKKGDNGKGIIVTGIIDSNFKALGIGIGWRLSKLGKRNVSKTSFIMLRNQLMAQASTAKVHGYELTFGDTTMKQNHSSQPNSPNMATQGTKPKTNIPGTAPFGPTRAKSNKPAQINMPAFDIKKTKSLDQKRRDIVPKQSHCTPQTGDINEDELRFKVTKKKRSSYKPQKTCDVVQEIDANTKKVRLYQDWPKYFTAEGCNGTNKGFAVKSVTNNEFGNALRALGIDHGWNITHCANKRLGNRMFAMLKNQISASAKMVGLQGYEVVFQKNIAPLQTPPLQNKPFSVPSSKPQTQPHARRQRSAPRHQAPLNAQKQYPKPNAQRQPQPMQKPSSFGQKKPQPMQSNQRKPLPSKPSKPQQLQLSQKAMAKLNKKPVIPPLATASKVSTTDKRNAYASNKDAAKKDASEEKITAKRGRPTTPRSKIQSVEVVVDGGNTKTLRLYHAFDRYIVSSAEKGPKGYKIAGFNKFGDDIKSVGIDIGWKLVKLEGKDVSRAFYQMVKNNVGVAFRKSNKKGYVVTLAAP